MCDVATNIIECVHCQQKLRVPVKMGTIQVTCPKCRSQWLVLPYRLVDIAQGTSEWLHWRNQGLGASDAPAIMGENPWKSRERLLKEKLNELSFWQNDAMRRGIELEPEARRRYEQMTGIKVRPVCLESTQFDWLRASIDGLAHDGSSVVEIKCGESVYRHAASKRQVPQYYLGQLQHILAVTGLPRIDFWCYLPGRPEIHICIDRDNNYIDRLIKREMEFWQEFMRRR
ncbi:YqaJ viral recombinase family protein [bacterium]|nr:YqaJ viral recombinase family protein [bacterium]